jgi:UDP-4-amino-4,6-dideoxy-N-acetyl-beta-L-altrosamine N-acetyltransferase
MAIWKLVQIIDLDTETQLKVLIIRNESSIRKWMYSDHVITVNEHLSWISRLKKDQTQYIWALLNDQLEPVGVVSLNKIDIINSKCEWAFYLSETARGGLGSALEFFLIEYAFNIFNIEKLNCEVLEGNDAVVKLHKRFHFTDEGFRRENVVKDGSRVGVHLLGLTKSEWIRNRDDVLAKYGEVFNKFSFQLTEKREAPGPLDLIEFARAKNNINWMSILRLALEKSPITAGSIVNEIKALDIEISALTEELTRDMPKS